MTWALQPCDTHVLALYKRQLRIEFQMKQIQNKLGTVSIRETVERTCRAIKSVLDTQSWNKSFMDTGVGSSQSMLSKSLLQVLHWKEPPPMSSDLPTLLKFQWRLCSEFSDNQVYQEQTGWTQQCQKWRLL